MSVPIPAPRFANDTTTTMSTTTKKPVPLPRRTKIKENQTISDNNSESSVNSLSRRVRSLSNASKQIAEDIGELVQDKKKAVIAGITRRFTTHQSNEFNNPDDEQEQKPEIGGDIDVFNSISFESPIHYSSSIYNNVVTTDVEEEFNLPPPKHPPPPLPDDSIYDAPASTSGGSTNSENSACSMPPPQNYESIFPSDSSDLSRSGSWRFYDGVHNNNNISNNKIETDIDVNSNVSDLSSSVVDIRNSIYENHEILRGNDVREIRAKASESVIFQFDPLKEQSTKTDPITSNNNNNATTDNLRMLEDYLQKDLYSNMSSIYTLDSWSISNESEDEYTPPPPPPLRFDSLPEEEQQPQQQQQSPNTTTTKSRTSWFTSSSTLSDIKQEQPSTPEPNKKLKWLKSVLEKAPDIIVKGVRNKQDAIVQRPQLEAKTFIHKKGRLFKVQNGPVEDLFGEYSARWCILQNSEFVCYSDNTCESVKERFPADSILSIQVIQDPKFKYKYENEELHCFELNTTGKSRGGHIYGARDLPERRVWMQYICESLCHKFKSKLTTNYTRMGWAYVREGVSGKWMGAWVMLSQRKIYYALDNQSLKSIDLRKARCILFQPYQENDNNPRTNDRGPNIVLDSTDFTLYLRMWTGRETKVWCHVIKLAAYNNGANLEEQQLTKDDIPVLVEKSINFIYAYGSMSEGIYRKPGTGKAVTELLVKFRKNAWDVQLTKDTYSEYDVATALKRFFRDLPEPLLSSSRRHYLHNVSLLKDKSERVRMYKAALEELPPIVLKTTKKLIGHLSFIASQQDKNLMNVDNLASIWGLTLMSSEELNNESKHINDAIVVSHLISLYKDIFPQDTAEVEQERVMLQFLQKYTKSPQASVSSTGNAGDFRVWIYIHNREGESINVAIGATRTAYEVCAELSTKMNLPVDQIILQEVVLNNKLTRPIHHTEKVLDIVLRWGYWDESDRKDNHLVIVPIGAFEDLNSKPKELVWDDLKFADTKTRHFKNYTFKIAQAKLNCYKDKMCDNLVTCWNVEDIIWYYGSEPKRAGPTRYSITFIETKVHPNRTKANPYFGNIIACSNDKERRGLLIGLIKAQYVQGLMPPVMHINLLN